jgi:NADPH:quinone reductase-like Zn-dependent oxidoreductase
MRRWVVSERFGLDHLQCVEADEPVPGPGQVLLEMSAWSLNYRDLLMARGEYDPRLPLPYVPLSDGVGRVLAAGPGVTRVAPGDRVCPTFSPGWLDGELDADTLKNTRGGQVPGLLAERVVVGQHELVAAPAHLSDAEAATLPCAGLTAWSALVTHGAVTAGQWVLVIGTGGVSVFATQLAKVAGARVVGITSTPEKAERLRALGAEHVVLRTEIAAWGKAVRQHTGGVDLVVEVGGAGTLDQSIEAVRIGGKVLIIGRLAGSREPVNVVPILMRQIRCQGVFVGHRRGFLAMARALEQHQVHPVVDRIFPFEEAPAALAALSEARHFGKIAITRS